jgi:DNA-binding transcriptional LysR family regulator
LASAIKGGEVGALRLALSRTVGLDLLTRYFSELSRLFAGLEMKLLRGTADDVVELLKKGDAELAIAGTIEETWERLDKWPLFTERFQLLVNRQHPLAQRPQISIDELGGQRFLQRHYCEDAAQTSALLRGHSIDLECGYDVTTDEDLRILIEADFGVAFAPRSMQTPADLAKIAVSEIELSRTVYVYGVAGRQRTAVATAMLKMLRAADWSRYSN